MLGVHTKRLLSFSTSSSNLCFRLWFFSFVMNDKSVVILPFLLPSFKGITLFPQEFLRDKNILRPYCPAFTLSIYLTSYYFFSAGDGALVVNHLPNKSRYFLKTKSLFRLNPVISFKMPIFWKSFRSWFAAGWVMFNNWPVILAVTIGCE